jgi:hypothetical protein
MNRRRRSGRLGGVQVPEPRPAENEGARVASSTPPQPKNREAVKNVITQYLTVNAENPYWPIDEMSSELTDVVMAVLPADPPPPAYRELHGWAVEEAVTCVACPDCAFTFDALHEDTGGGYSCPACSEIAK